MAGRTKPRTVEGPKAPASPAEILGRAASRLERATRAFEEAVLVVFSAVRRVTIRERLHPATGVVVGLGDSLEEIRVRFDHDQGVRAVKVWSVYRIEEELVAEPSEEELEP